MFDEVIYLSYNFGGGQAACPRFYFTGIIYEVKRVFHE